MHKTASSSKERYLFIDLLRFIAAVFMIQGHVFDAVLSVQVKSHPLYYRYDFFHGFVAPAFLFASGLAYGISTIRRWDEHIIWSKRVGYRAGRFLGLIAVGYALHLPYFSLRKTVAESSPQEIAKFLQCDVLQCIGVTLLALQAAVFIVKQRRTFAWIVSAAAAIAIFAAPLMWSAHLSERFPIALVSYLTPETGSWFPLFPWAGYILCGVVLGGIFAEAQSGAEAAAVMLKAGVLSVLVLSTAWAVMYFPVNLYPPHDFWKSNPAMFFVRVSVVSILANGIFLVENWAGRVSQIPSILGRQSFFIYILHLLVVYGSVMNRGLAQRIGPVLDVPQSLGVFVIVVGVIGLVALLWHKLKTEHAGAASLAMGSAAAVFLYEFVKRPW